MKTNPIPSYYASQHCNQDGDIVPGVFDVYEIREGKTLWMFKIRNGGDILGNILKRGIPLESAKLVLYQMDGV